MIRIKDSNGNAYYLWKNARGATALTGQNGVPHATSNVFGRQTALVEMAVEDAGSDEEMLAAARKYLPHTYVAETVKLYQSRKPVPDKRITVVVTDVFGNRGYVHRQTDGRVEYRSETGVNLGLPDKDSFLAELRLGRCHTPSEMKLFLDDSFKKVELLERDEKELREQEAELSSAVNVLAELVGGAINEDEANEYLYGVGYEHGNDTGDQIGSVHAWIDSVANSGGSPEEAADFLEYFGVSVDPVVAPAP